MFAEYIEVEPKSRPRAQNNGLTGRPLFCVEIRKAHFSLTSTTTLAP